MRLALPRRRPLIGVGCDDDTTTGPGPEKLVEPLYRPAIGMTWTYDRAVAGDSIAVFQVAVSQTWPNNVNTFYYAHRGVDDQGLFSARPDRGDTPGAIYRGWPSTCSDDDEHSPDHYSDFYLAADIGTTASYVHARETDELVRVASVLAGFDDGQGEGAPAAIRDRDEARASEQP